MANQSNEISEVSSAEKPDAISTDAAPVVAVVVDRDFGFLPIPRRLRYTGNPVSLGLVLNVGFGIASTFTVGNLYYCQPLLVTMSTDFGVAYSEVSRVPTLVQAGYATGLLLISPLGDLVRRRPLLLLIVLLAAALSIGLAITRSFIVFEVLSFFVGAFTVTPQVLLPMAADMARPERRASTISIVLSGLLLGVLVARVLAGTIGQFVTWRVVYFLAIGMQFVVLLMLYLIVPDYPAKNAHLRYHQILFSMAKFAVTEPVLIQAMFITMLASACFSNFWVTLTFLLSEAPYRYSTLAIGLFGLIGIGGVTAAPFTGRLVDHMVPWSSTLVTTISLILFTGLETGAGGVNISAVVISCFGMDICRQMQQVSLTSVVMATEPSASARLNSVVILFNFIGQVMGTSVGTRLFVQYGWRPAAAVSTGWTCLQLILLLMRGPHCERYTWFGYEHGLEFRKSKALENKRRREHGAESPVDEKEEMPNSPGTDEKKG